MNIPMTRRKLEEARFFLGQMETATRKTHADWDVFGYYHSAFVSASRSVPWCLQAENQELYRRVHPTWEQGLSPDERTLLKCMNERRLDEVKRTGAEITPSMVLVPVTDLPHGLGDPGIM